MEKHNFDGFEAIWECVPCRSGRLSDVYYYQSTNELMRHLSEAFKPRGWLLSAFPVINKTAIEAGFDIQKLSQYVDWMTVLPIDLSEQANVLHAPLYSYQGDTSDEFNANWSINYLIERGVPSNKLLLNVIFRGVSFRLDYGNGVNAQTDYGRHQYQFYDICSTMKKKNLTIVHNTSRVGSYAYQDDYWISYDDVEDVYRKAAYILHMNLGGVSINYLDGDDFENKCHCAKSPLLTAFNQVLRNVDGPKNNNCT